MPQVECPSFLNSRARVLRLTKAPSKRPKCREAAGSMGEQILKTKTQGSVGWGTKTGRMDVAPSGEVEGGSL